MTNTASLVPTIKALEYLFEVLNTYLFGGKLERPVITASPTKRQGVLGWFTCWKAWKEDGTDGYYEINVCSESLSLPLYDVIGILLHEMVHLFCMMNGIQDCSRNGYYHNTRFREIAEAHGLNCERDKTYGWALTKLTDATAAWLKEKYGSCSNAFPIFRDSSCKTSSRVSSYRKYVCPNRCVNVGATKEAYVICGICKSTLQLQSKK